MKEEAKFKQGAQRRVNRLNLAGFHVFNRFSVSQIITRNHNRRNQITA